MKKQILLVLLIIIMSTSCGDKMDINDMNFNQKVDYIIENMPLRWSDYNKIFNYQLKRLEPVNESTDTSQTFNVYLSENLVNDVGIRERTFATFTYFDFNPDNCHSAEYFIEKYFKGEKPAYYAGDGEDYEYYTLHKGRWTFTLTVNDDGKTKCLQSLLFKDHLYGD